MAKYQVWLSFAEYYTLLCTSKTSEPLHIFFTNVCFYMYEFLKNPSLSLQDRHYTLSRRDVRRLLFEGQVPDDNFTYCHYTPVASQHIKTLHMKLKTTNKFIN